MVEGSTTFAPIDGSSRADRQPAAIPNLDMYRIPGDSPGLQFHTETYRRTSDRMTGLIQGYIDANLERDYPRRLDLTVANLIRFLPVEQRAGYIDKCLSGNYLADLKAEAARQIGALPEELRAEYIDKIVNNFTSTDVVYKAAIEQIHTLPEKQRIIYINRFIGGKNHPWIRLAVSRQIYSLPERKRTRPLVKYLNNRDNDRIKQPAAWQVYTLPERHKRRTLRKLIERRDELSIIAIKQVHTIRREGKRKRILVGCLENPFSEKSLLAAIEQIGALPKRERERFVAKFIGKDNSKDIRLATIRQIGTLPEAQREDPFIACINDDDLFIRRAAVEQTNILPQGRREYYAEKLINERFHNIHSAGQTRILLGLLPEEKRVQLIIEWLNNRDSSIRYTATQQMELLSDENRQSIMSSFSDILNIADLESTAQTTPLYKWTLRRGGRLGKHPFFGKTSSKITLLETPNPTTSFKNRVIIRTMPTLRYYPWKIAFEASDFWKSEGFGYVPIEPIIKANQNNEGDSRVDVYTRVLQGPSYLIWQEKTSLYRKEIEDQIKRITDGLQKLGIFHNQSYFPGNFVLVFDRDEDNKPIISRPPRVYLIDFDESSLHEADHPVREISMFS